MPSNNNKVYVTHEPMTENQVLEKAAEIIASKHVDKDAFTSCQATRDFLRFKLGTKEREVFSVMLLDNHSNKAVH